MGEAACERQEKSGLGGPAHEAEAVLTQGMHQNQDHDSPSGGPVGNVGSGASREAHREHRARSCAAVSRSSER